MAVRQGLMEIQVGGAMFELIFIVIGTWIALSVLAGFAWARIGYARKSGPRATEDTSLPARSVDVEA